METQTTRYDQLESKLILKKKDHVSTNKSERLSASANQKKKRSVSLGETLRRRPVIKTSTSSGRAENSALRDPDGSIHHDVDLQQRQWGAVKPGKN